MSLPFKIKPQDLTMDDIVERIEATEHLFFMFTSNQSSILTIPVIRTAISPLIHRYAEKVRKEGAGGRMYTCWRHDIHISSDLSDLAAISTVKSALGEPSAFAETRYTSMRFRYDTLTCDPYVIEKTFLSLDKEVCKGGPRIGFAGKLTDYNISLPYREAALTITAGPQEFLDIINPPSPDTNQT